MPEAVRLAQLQEMTWKTQDGQQGVDGFIKEQEW